MFASWQNITVTTLQALKLSTGLCRAGHNLAELLDLRSPGLYPVRVIGQELRGRGIQHGDILIANAAADPAPGKVCVAFLQGEVILATLTRKGKIWWLAPATREPIEVSDDVEIWAIIKALMRIRVSAVIRPALAVWCEGNAGRCAKAISRHVTPLV